jgi:DNA polymerase-3 subunit delta
VTVIPNSRADHFVAQPHEEIGFFLVHGADEGLVNERAKAILSAASVGSAAQLVRLAGDDIARQPGLLADEAYALSLFGEKRVILIEAQARDFSPALGPLLARRPKDCPIVVKSGLLKKDSPLRSVFEKAANAASVECYPDSSDALDALIDQEARSLGIDMSASAREALSGLLGADRPTARNELAKLWLYSHGCDKIGVADVTAILGDEGLGTADHLVDQSLQAGRPVVAASAARMFGVGVENELLLQRLAARLMLLYRLRLEVDQGGSVESAQRSLGVRLPFAAMKALGDQAKRWTSGSTAQKLGAIRGVSAKARSDVALARLMIIRALWALSSSTSPPHH